MTDANEATTIVAKPTTKRPRKMAREPKAEGAAGLTPDAGPAKRQTKADLVLGLLRRPEGAPSINLSQQRAGCRIPPELRWPASKRKATRWLRPKSARSPATPLRPSKRDGERQAEVGQP